MTRKFISMTCLLLLAANMSIAQYLNRLYDYDTTHDWGTGIFLKGDTSLFITGGSMPSSGKWAQINMTISVDGNTVLDKKRVVRDSAWLYSGDYGQSKKIPGGGYLVPVVVQYPNPVTGYLYSMACLMKYNEGGDTAFMKTYTDTITYFERILTCDVMPDGGFLGGGTHAMNVPSYYPALILRTDTAGDTLWTRSYQKHPTQYAQANAVIGLPDGRIVAGLHSRYDVVTPALDVYYHFSPWFMLLDGDGHVIRDTVYGPKYGGGGRLYRDTIGGYAHIGQIDTLAYPLVVESYKNMPCYIAHLDTNFRMSWETRLPYDDNGRRHPLTVKQLHDGNYLAVGISEKWPKIWAWAAKVNRNTGDIIWDWYYNSDSTNDNYFSDAAEKPDGSLVFVGATFNDTLPSYRRVFDVWLLGTDSNGCPSPLCFGDTGTTHTHVVVQPGAFSLFPNPTKSGFTVYAPSQGFVSVSDMQGRVMLSAVLREGNNELSMPPNVSGGIYVCRFAGNETGQNAVLKFVYSP